MHCDRAVEACESPDECRSAAVGIVGLLPLSEVAGVTKSTFPEVNRRPGGCDPFIDCHLMHAEAGDGAQRDIDDGDSSPSEVCAEESTGDARNHAVGAPVSRLQGAFPFSTRLDKEIPGFVLSRVAGDHFDHVNAVIDGSVDQKRDVANGRHGSTGLLAWVLRNSSTCLRLLTFWPETGASILTPVARVGSRPVPGYLYLDEGDGVHHLGDQFSQCGLVAAFQRRVH